MENQKRAEEEIQSEKKKFEVVGMKGFYYIKPEEAIPYSGQAFKGMPPVGEYVKVELPPNEYESSELLGKITYMDDKGLAINNEIFVPYTEIRSVKNLTPEELMKNNFVLNSCESYTGMIKEYISPGNEELVKDAQQILGLRKDVFILDGIDDYLERNKAIVKSYEDSLNSNRKRIEELEFGKLIVQKIDNISKDIKSSTFFERIFNSSRMQKLQGQFDYEVANLKVYGVDYQHGASQKIDSSLDEKKEMVKSFEQIVKKENERMSVLSKAKRMVEKAESEMLLDKYRELTGSETISKEQQNVLRDVARNLGRPPTLEDVENMHQELGKTMEKMQKCVRLIDSATERLDTGRMLLEKLSVASEAVNSRSSLKDIFSRAINRDEKDAYKKLTTEIEDLKSNLSKHGIKDKKDYEMQRTMNKSDVASREKLSTTLLSMDKRMGFLTETLNLYKKASSKELSKEMGVEVEKQMPVQPKEMARPLVNQNKRLEINMA